MTASFRIVVLLALVAGVAACGGDLRRNLGIDRTGPDEFRVVARAPLEMPPDYGLRPPQPGAPRPNEPTVREQARATVFGTQGRAPEQVAGRTSGESALLRQAGAVNADPAIRETVNRETAQIARAERGLVDRLIFWRTAETPASVVDAQAEAQRIRENAALGRAVTQGDTPVIQRRRRGLLEGLF